ncbi:hypothetical protein ACFSN5_08325 [Streptococcus tangpeifui]|uniref:hypothetical protein n=1 Tax=Streptococcus tangpeifui TaxID=2709400 RepID=UPI0013EA2551|nr:MULTISPECIES: hypothetical protein [unclassified Streptococcus]
MFLKYEEVIEFLKEKEIYSEDSKVIWATKRIGRSSTNAYFLLIFSSDRIIVIGVSAMGKPEEVLEVIEVADMERCDFKKKLLMGYQLTIETKESKSTLHVNKAMVGTKWHKENFESIQGDNFAYVKFT